MDSDFIRSPDRLHAGSAASLGRTGEDKQPVISPGRNHGSFFAERHNFTFTPLNEHEIDLWAAQFEVAEQIEFGFR